jgi:predicted phage terminase large subunit-like protein
MSILNILSDPYKVAKYNLFVYTSLVVEHIEPNWVYDDRFFTTVISWLQYFNNTNIEKTLFLEAPPRTGKTELSSIINISQILGREKNRRFLIVAGNRTLRNKIRRGVVRIITSSLYKKIFPEVVTITNNQTELILNNGNYILFMTTGTQVPTGEGFHYIVLVDFINATVINSEAKLENAYEQLEGILSRTQSDPDTKVLIDNQRLSANDLSVTLKKRHEEGGEKYICLTFPYHFNSESKYILPNNKVIKFNDTEFLVSRFNAERKKRIIATVGPDVFEAQYQQNPPLTSSIFFKREWLKYTDDINIIKYDSIWISIDTGFKTAEYNDPTGFVIFGISGKNIYVLEAIAKRMEFYVLESFVKDLINKYKQKVHNVGILIEDKGSGQSLIQNLRVNVRGIIPIKPEGSKEHRLHKAITSIRITLESGCFFLPTNASWKTMYENELLGFPNTAHDDLVDATSQFFNYMSNRPRSILDAI